ERGPVDAGARVGEAGGGGRRAGGDDRRRRRDGEGRREGVDGEAAARGAEVPGRVADLGGQGHRPLGKGPAAGEVGGRRGGADGEQGGDVLRAEQHLEGRRDHAVLVRVGDGDHGA